MTSKENIWGVPILGPLECFPSLLKFHSRDGNGDFSTSTSTLAKEKKSYYGHFFNTPPGTFFHHCEVRWMKTVAPHGAFRDLHEFE